MILFSSSVTCGWHVSNTCVSLSVLGTGCSPRPGLRGERGGGSPIDVPHWSNSSPIHNVKLSHRDSVRREWLIDWLQSDILKTFGLPTEAHFVFTEDGYKLRLDRLVNKGRQPVYLAHGMQTSSPSFALLGKKKSLSMRNSTWLVFCAVKKGSCFFIFIPLPTISFAGVLLHEAGYDVWMVNYRGTHYSLEHKHLTTDDDKFWKFR